MISHVLIWQSKVWRGDSAIEVVAMEDVEGEIRKRRIDCVWLVLIFILFYLHKYDVARSYWRE
jgi:hypothetical protein